MPSGLDTVLGKAVAILESFTVDHTMLSFTDLLASTGLPKSTLHRLVTDLQTNGLLENVDGRYRLSRLVFELGMRASVERSLIEVATPYLEDLYERTHETVHLAVRESQEVVYVLKIGGHRQAASPSRLGGRMPLHATAIGKAMLAHAPLDVREQVLGAPLRRCSSRTITSAAVLGTQLDEIVRRGVSFEYEESAVGIVCVASPVLDASGTAVAAVSVAGPISRLHPARHASAVAAAAAGIAATLARRPR